VTGEPIRTLRPRVTREQAIEILAGGFAGAVRRVARGPLRSVAAVFIPFELYRVTVIRGTARETVTLGIDLVDGALDLYRFDPPPRSNETESICTRNGVAQALSTSAAEDALRSRVTRLAYQKRGFLAAGHVDIDLESLATLYVPYWAGFFGRHASASLVVLDALRCRFEGPKVRRLIRGWLTGEGYDPGSFKYGASRRAVANSVRASS